MSIKKIELTEKIQLSENIKNIQISEYLIASNKEKISNLLNNNLLIDEETFIDIFISLHIIIEVSINSLFRLMYLFIVKNINELKLMETIDSINFIDKVTLFIYNSHFNTKMNKKEATKHYKIIDILKDFSSIRNKLLHGHAIASINNSSNIIKKSPLKKKLDLNYLQNQIIKFKQIMQGLSFFVDNIEKPITESGKKQLIKSYLDYSFLPKTYFKNK